LTGGIIRKGKDIMATVMAPGPNQQFATRGKLYIADAQGIITNVALGDLFDLLADGCEQLGVMASGYTLIGRMLGVNMNLAGSGAAAQDQSIPLFIGTNVSFRVRRIVAMNASASLTTAVGGIYTATAQGGTAVVAANQAYSALTGATLALDVPIVTTPGNTVWAGGTPLIVNLSTAQGAAATCDMFVYGELFK
jgi:hypothetical protein